ncbi:MAG: hypothetical protein WD940_00335 [Patescibacteria group bacterium]
MEVSGNCTKCGDQLPLEGYVGGWVKCESCGTPNLIPVVFPQAIVPVSAVESMDVSTQSEEKDTSKGGSKLWKAVKWVFSNLGAIFALVLALSAFTYTLGYFLGAIEVGARGLVVIYGAISLVVFLILVSLVKKLVR